MSTGPLPTRRVKTAWTDPDHMRLVHDLEERMNDKRSERRRTPDLHDPWAIQAGDDCGIQPAGEGEPDA